MISGEGEAEFIKIEDEEIDPPVNTKDEFIEVEPEN